MGVWEVEWLLRMPHGDDICAGQGDRVTEDILPHRETWPFTLSEKGAIARAEQWGPMICIKSTPPRSLRGRPSLNPAAAWTEFFTLQGASVTGSHAALWYLIPEVPEIFPGYMQGLQQVWERGLQLQV